MFEFVIEKEQKRRSLDKASALKVAQDIGSLWKTWDDARSKQKMIADTLKPEIYLDERKNLVTENEDSWKSDIKLNKIYAFNQTQQAAIWDNIYSSVEHLFDVTGADAQSEAHAAEQKNNLVNIFNKIGIQRKLDRAVEYLGSVGEVCLFISWKTVYRQIRRKLDKRWGDVLFSTERFGIYNEEVYNGADVEAIDPLNLVFDPKVLPEDGAKFDACGKIIKSFETYDSVANNKLYKLSKEDLAEIRRALNHMPQEDQKEDKSDLVIDDNRIEVLQYWGNYTLSDGTVLRNWSIVSIGRKYLALFEANRWVINPIINCAIFRDSVSKRGIPELWSIYDLCKEQEKKVNLQNDAQALNLNPPSYAPEGFFEEKEVKLYPGRIINYKIGTEDPGSLKKMEFPLFSNEKIIEYYDSTASTVSGIFPNMQGQSEATKVTATEINAKINGQTTRLSKLLDTIKQNAIVPMVSKVADLEANMKSGDEEVFMDIGGVRTSFVIGDVVRQGRYEYKYTDNTGIERKLQQNQTLTNILGPVWNDQEVKLNKRELIVDALTNAGIENAEKYVGDALETIPPLQAPAQQANFNSTGDADGQGQFGTLK